MLWSSMNYQMICKWSQSTGEVDGIDRETEKTIKCQSLLLCVLICLFFSCTCMRDCKTQISDIDYDCAETWNKQSSKWTKCLNIRLYFSMCIPSQPHHTARLLVMSFKFIYVDHSNHLIDHNPDFFFFFVFFYYSFIRLVIRILFWTIITTTLKIGNQTNWNIE